jgi:hypothetical protein
MLMVILWKAIPAITEDNWAGGIQIETQPNTDGYTENMRSNRTFCKCRTSAITSVT